MWRLLFFALVWTAVAGAEPLPRTVDSVKSSDSKPPASSHVAKRRKRIARPFAVLRRAAQAEVNLAERLSSWGIPSPDSGK